MGLNVVKFFQVKPKLPFRFKTIWYTGLSKTDDEYLTYAVQSITLPKMEIDNTAGASNFGDVRLYVPVFNPGVRKLEFTFEETDHLHVTKFLHQLLNYSYSKTPYHITIILKEYDEHFHKEKSKAYICHLASYEEPSFKRDGSAQQITVNASFLVDTIINPWNDGMKVQTGYAKPKISTLYNSTYDTLAINEENVKFTGGKFLTNNSGTQNNTGTKDFNISDDEIKNALAKINSEGGSGGKNVTYEQLKEVQEYNAAKMSEAYKKLQDQLKSEGIVISVNAYNDTVHAVGLGTKSGSHLLGQKIDLNFTDALGNKLTSQNMTAEQKKKIEAAAKAAGLVANYESSNGQDSFWGDFALAQAMSIDSSGKTVKDKKMNTWTGGNMYRTDLSGTQKFGK